MMRPLPVSLNEVQTQEQLHEGAGIWCDTIVCEMWNDASHRE